jgi:hypothetical protein
MGKEMKLSKDYIVPEGFLPVLNYREIQSGEAKVGECCLPLDDYDLIFWIGDPIEKVPVLPLKGYGELWHTGWDIPTKWAIDGAGQCWINDGHHGSCLFQVPNEVLLNEVEDEDDANKFRERLGLPIKEPKWMSQARTAGWQPPKK